MFGIESPFAITVRPWSNLQSLVMEQTHCKFAKIRTLSGSVDYFEHRHTQRILALVEFEGLIVLFDTYL